MSKTVKVGLIGAGFVTDLHEFSFRHYVPNAEVVAVASVTPGKAAHFAKERGIPHAFDNYRDLLALKEIDVVTVAIPNDLHAQVTIDAAHAGKHVICEKPLCKTLAEADRMIDECQKHGVLLLYAEELLFAPKYVRAKTLIDEGALGRVFLAKQMEEHSGPHMPWFWDVTRSGGGVLLDMGCHSIEYTRWVLGKPKVKSVSATMGTFVHTDKTQGEDHRSLKPHICSTEAGVNGGNPQTCIACITSFDQIVNLRRLGFQLFRGEILVEDLAVPCRNAKNPSGRP
jgi:predicted dehydrogenase